MHGLPHSARHETIMLCIIDSPCRTPILHHNQLQLCHVAFNRLPALVQNCGWPAGNWFYVNTSELAVATGLPAEAPLVEVVTGVEDALVAQDDGRLVELAHVLPASPRLACQRALKPRPAALSCLSLCRCRRLLSQPPAWRPSLAAEAPGTYIGRGPPTATEILGGRRRGPDVS